MVKFINPLNALRSRQAMLEQHIAVFGESGSGKTTLLSAFYGWHNEPAISKTNRYSLKAVDTSQGQELLRKYLKMKEEGSLPGQTRYQHDAFKFNIDVRGLDKSAGLLVWHDYPGEWWTETKEDTENKRKILAFRTLLQSDVAFFLCDAQQLSQEGDIYLRRLFKTFREELQRQKSNLRLEDNSLDKFPRTWIICLSKSDLMPDEDVYKFRNRVIKSVGDELDELKEVIEEMIEGDSYKSIGEAFLLLSSAEIDPSTGKVKNTSRTIGLDLIPPISIFLPIQNAVDWENTKANFQFTIQRFVEVTRSLTTNWAKYIPIVSTFFMLLDDTAKSSIAELEKIEAKSRLKQDSALAVTAAFAMKLKEEGNEKIYLSGK